MEIPTMEDFKRFESNMIKRFEELKEILLEQNCAPVQRVVLTVKDVEEEFKVSAHVQRVARQKGNLIFKKISKEVQYDRYDVEDWIKTKIVR